MEREEKGFMTLSNGIVGCE